MSRIKLHTIVCCLVLSAASSAHGYTCAFSEQATGSTRQVPGTVGHHVVLMDVQTSLSTGYIDGKYVGNIVTFCVTPDVTGWMTVSTCHPATAYDTVLEVNTGGEGGCCGEFPTIVAVNDDTYDPGCPQNCNGSASKVTFYGYAGQSYCIRVGSYNNNPSGCYLCLGLIVSIGTPCGDVPDNFLCGLAKELPGAPGIHEVKVDVTDAPSNPATWSCSGSSKNIGHSVWFTFTPEITGTAEFSTCHTNTAYDTVVRALTGSCTGIFSTLDCNDDSIEQGCSNACGTNRGSSVSFPVNADQQYFVEVGAYNDNSAGCNLCLGALLTIKECAGPGQCNDDNPCTEDICEAGMCVNTPLPDGTACPDDGNPCTDDVCYRGTCGHPPEPAGTPCGDQSNTDCNNPDTCDGSGQCLPNNEPYGTTCTSDGNPCTNDICNGTGSCTHPYASYGTPCGDQSNTDCTNPDFCNGSGQCLANNAPYQTACADDGNDCTNDWCNGVGSCTHPYAAYGTACGDQADTECTDPDFCNGSGQCLANNALYQTACADDGNDCTNDWCNGVGSCTHPYAAYGTACGDPVDTECTDPDFCNGSGQCLTNNAPSGMPCPDDLFCDGSETCDGMGDCQPGERPCWEDEICNEDNDMCERGSPLIRNYTPIAWQAEQVDWIRDLAPRNKVDDLIDESDEPPFDVVVNFKREVLDEDIDMLDALGFEVQTRLKYLSSITLDGLSREDVQLIAELPEVAFVEQQVGFQSTLDVSIPSICVTPAAGGCANTVPAGTDGTGINIVIMDSGVDNVVHNGFTTGQYVAGYDAITKTYTDPDDDYGHGTHVASIALGSGTVNTARGVAPGAGLIDVRVFDAATTCGTLGMWKRIVDGLEKTYDNRNKWNVHVINMSFGSCNASGPVYTDGLDAFSQLVDLAESMGIVVVVSAGNNGPGNSGLSSPASATRAITVAASETLDTVNRADDNIADFSSRGPRDNDNDSDQIDELKPEVTAPGNNQPPEDWVFNNDPADADVQAWTRTTAQVNSGANVTVNVTSSADIAARDIIGFRDLTGEIVDVTTSAGAGGTSFTATTSMIHFTNAEVREIMGIRAARHDTANQAMRMAGTSMAAPHVAGLAALIMQDRSGINAASVKDLIISTAELPMGTPASLPAVDPTWNDTWGWGLINAYEAIDVTQETDLTFPNHPPTPHWLSPDIITTQLMIGKPATVTAKIRNLGPSAASNVRVHFGVHVFSASTTTFYDLGTKIVDIPVNPTGSTDVSIQWTPKNVGHQCFKVEIGYGPDMDYSNNKAQRNIMVSHKTATMFYVKNTLIQDLSRIRFNPSLEDADAGWDFRVEPAEVFLGGDDPAAEIIAELLPPPDAEPGQQQMLHVEALIDTDGGPVSLGGITLQYVVTCENDYDGDGDVDGLDLAALAENPEGKDLAALAADFGRTDCNTLMRLAACQTADVCRGETGHRKDWAASVKSLNARGPLKGAAENNPRPIAGAVTPVSSVGTVL